MASCGITAGDKRIGKALSIVSPLYQVQRNTNTARQTNPYPYHADYFGHKLHMDQNEKLAMYGLTEVSACDGYSGKIVAFATMPVKNNVLIYENVYRYSIRQQLLQQCFHFNNKHFQIRSTSKGINSKIREAAK